MNTPLFFIPAAICVLAMLGGLVCFALSLVGEVAGRVAVREGDVLDGELRELLILCGRFPPD